MNQLTLRNIKKDFKKKFVKDDGQMRGGDAIPLDIEEWLTTEITSLLEGLKGEELEEKDCEMYYKDFTQGSNQRESKLREDIERIIG